VWVCRVLASQRQAAILDDLQRVGVVSVGQLAERFDVTDETIRRDLGKLQRAGRLVRTHGGALPPDEAAGELPFAVRQVTNAAAKRALAREAVKLVEPGDVIAIDASTTGLELAKALPDLADGAPVTVVSNGLDVVRWLADRPGVNVISTGGEFDAAGVCFVGSIAEATLGQFAFRRAFVSCRAIDPARGAAEACPSHAAIKRAMLGLAEEAYLLADSSKLSERGVCFFASLDRFAGVVIEPTADPAIREQLASAGVPLWNGAAVGAGGSR